MVLLQAKHASALLRKSRAQLEKFGPDPNWYHQTRDVVHNVFEHRADLASGYGEPWHSEQMEDPEPDLFKASLDGLIRAINCTDEIRFAKHPVLLLTALGIAFLLVVAGGTVLYYMLFLSG